MFVITIKDKDGLMTFGSIKTWALLLLEVLKIYPIHYWNCTYISYRIWGREEKKILFEITSKNENEYVFKSIIRSKMPSSGWISWEYSIKYY